MHSGAGPAPPQRLAAAAGHCTAHPAAVEALWRPGPVRAAGHLSRVRRCGACSLSNLASFPMRHNSSPAVASGSSARASRTQLGPQCALPHACKYTARRVPPLRAGFREWPLLEDLDLVQRLGWQCGPPAIVPRPLRTSGRRWARLGLLRTTLLNQAILLGHALGVDVNVLAGWYAAGERGR